MSALDTLVNVDISVQANPIPVASFSIPLIIGPTVPTSGSINAYTDPSGMLDNGYLTSSPEYKYAQKLFSQEQSPTEFFVGKRTTAIAQVDTITPTAVNTTHYIVTIDSVAYDYLSDSSATVSEIVAGLIALINADTNAPVVATGSTTLILTAKTVGQGFDTQVNGNMALVHTTANNGIVNDLLAMIAINNSWYGIILCSNQDYDILQLSGEVETLTKIFIGVSNDAPIATSVTNDLLSQLKALGYNRSALMFSPTSYNLGIEAAWMGGQLPSTPGSNDWAYKQLTGINPDPTSAINDSQRAIIIGDPVAQIAGKNGNIYTVVQGFPITQMGQMVSGRYIDITIGVDWLVSTIQTNVMVARTQAKKIPYTDKGTQILIQAVEAAILQGVTNGLIDGDSPITITAPKVLDVPASQRANRVAPTISFTCRLQGAVSAVNIEGTLTV